ncbi:MAG: hypothetical protein KKA70_12675, partial [Proteobacteria bacterium]|nr:hypothetical protein [Pseudomonadota bacterium]
MRIIKQILLIYFVVILMPSQVNAWFWGGLKKDQLVSVNDQIYTADDFRNWWEIWKEEDTLFPESMDEFVNWHLLVQEAKYMELDLQPSYKQKLDVFLSARTRSLLKMDEIDSKIDISEEDIFEKYLQDYSPIWDTRLIYFIDEQSAQEAYRRIVAEDYDVDKILKNHTELTGFSGIDSKKLRPVSFASNEQLLEIFKNLEKEKVSSPFAYGKFYIVAHLFEIIIEEDSSNIPPAVRKKIKKDLHKIKSTELTRSFLEMLKTKYKVQLDDDLILGLDPQNTTETQMEKTFIKTTIGDFPLRILVDDLKRNKDINSPGLSPEKNKEIRYNMINYILFDVLSKRESLDRHYEKVPPFKWQYEYYTQHRLIKEFEANILGDLAIVSADEII